MKDTTGCLYRETGDPKACLRCSLPECVEKDEGTDWKDEFAEQNRPNCPVCGRLMRRTGQYLSKNGDVRHFKYECRKCKKYARIGTQEEGYREPSEVPWETKFHDDNRPWCCGHPMMKQGVKKWEATGACSFNYKCNTCGGFKVVKTYEDKHFPDNPTLKALDPTRIDELIRSKMSDEDGIQDAWLAVLEQGVTTEDEVLDIAGKTFSRVRSQTIRRHYTGVNLSELGRPDEPEPASPDRFSALGVKDSTPLEEAQDTEPVRCPYCQNRNTLVMVKHYTDQKGTRRKFLCRACWRFTIWPRTRPYRQQGKVHASAVEIGDEIDVSSICRKAVAEKVRTTPAYISQVLCGRETASLPLFYDIAKACNCTMDELFRTISGANGKNPARLKYAPRSRYFVDGVGYPNLQEALRSLGVWINEPNYNRLSPSVKARITRNEAFRRHNQQSDLKEGKDTNQTLTPHFYPIKTANEGILAKGEI